MSEHSPESAATAACLKVPAGHRASVLEVNHRQAKTTAQTKHSRAAAQPSINGLHLGAMEEELSGEEPRISGCEDRTELLSWS